LLRHAFVPQPVMGRTPAQLRAYVDGPDNVTGRPFMTEVFDALTKPSADETNPHLFDRSTPRFVDTWNAQRFVTPPACATMSSTDAFQPTRNDH
jgi:hypothetical protein